VNKRTGFYPRVRVDGSSGALVSQAGATVLLETVRAVGLDRALSAALEPWHKPTAVHDPAKVITDLALTLALGGDCLADIAVLREQPEVFGRVASDPTVSRTIDALAQDPTRALSAINSARATARSTAWRLAGHNAPDRDIDARSPLIIDVDATLVTSHSDKEHAAPTFKRGFGFHPLCTFVDHGSDGTGEPLAVMLRAGNAGSNTAADHINVVREALRQLPSHRTGTRPGRKVLVRTDGAGCTHEFLDWLIGQRLSYSLGFTLPTDFAPVLTKIPKTVWTEAYDSNGKVRDGAWVADVTGLMDCPGGHQGCGSSSAKNAPIPAHNCGSPTSTATGSPRSSPTPRPVAPAHSYPTSSCATAAAHAAKTASGSPRTPACATSHCTTSPRTRSGSPSSR
jgi:hypothetical protein